MSEWVEVLRAPVDQDLGPFRRFLQEQGLETYVFERDGGQSLCVPAATDQAWLQVLVERWNAPDVDRDRYLAEPDPAAAAGPEPTIFAQWRQFPLTLLLLAASVAGFLLVSTPVGGLQWLALLTLQTLSVAGGEIRVLAQWPGLAEGWRYWSPLFLHFSLFHILFNGLLLLDIGRRIEILQGSQRLLFLVASCGLVSNLVQFEAAPQYLFGGMSGVIYALVGYCWLYQRLCPQLSFSLPPGLLVVAIIWLLLCLSGVVTLVGLGNIANAAHVGGLAAGLVMAVLLAWLDRHWPTSPGLP